MERYYRQIILSGFGIEKQRLLTSAKVLVIGAGGLGSPALQYLAGAGIGTIGIIDHDRVSLSNLHRQVIFSEEDIGKSKAETAARFLQKRNSDIEILYYDEELNIVNAHQMIEAYDLIIDGTDNFSTRYLVNDICKILSKPLIYGAIYKHEGQVSLFNVEDEKGLAYDLRDLFPKIPHQYEVPNCSEVGVLGSLAGQIGTIMASVTIQLIIGMGKTLAGKILMVNSLSYQTYLINLSKNEDSIYDSPKSISEIQKIDYGFNCANNEVKNIHVRELDELKEKYPNCIFLDVREADELPKLQGINLINIPMSVLTKELEKLKNYTGIIVCCQTGIRSLKAAGIIQVKFPEKIVYQLEGGISNLV